MHCDHRVNRLRLHELQALLAVAQAGSMTKLRGSIPKLQQGYDFLVISDIPHPF
jgi:hypothetical protein